MLGGIIMRAAIYGAGSLGIILGAYLARAGQDVELVNRNMQQVAALREHGARVTGTADMVVPVKALQPDEMSGIYDVIFLLTKQLDNHATAVFLKPFLGVRGVVCTMQNGIPEPALMEVLGQDRVMGCTVNWGATLREPGVSILTSSLDSLSFGMGRVAGEADERFLAVKAMLENMCPVEVQDNFAGVRWSKLLINAAFSGMGTVIGGTYGDVVRDRRARAIALAAVKECIDAGHAAGAAFAPVQGKDIVRLLYYKGRVKKALAMMIIPIAMKKHMNTRPSMLQDIENNKPCEINAINGIVCEYGRKFGVPTPVNDTIVLIVTQEQEGSRAPGIKNLSMF
jgi:2-dehydropantoate 2-reductase